MKDYSRRRAHMRRLYVEGAEINEIAAIFGITNRTVHHHKQKDRGDGVDWNELRMERRLSAGEGDRSHREFLDALAACFRADRAKLDEEQDPAKRLELLERYTRSYYRLTMAARRNEPTAEVSELVARVIELLAKVALDERREDVARFLMDHLDAVAAEIKREFFGK